MQLISVKREHWTNLFDNLFKDWLHDKHCLTEHQKKSVKWCVCVCVCSTCSLLSYACTAIVDTTTVHQVTVCILSQIGFLL